MIPCVRQHRVRTRWPARACGAQVWGGTQTDDNDVQVYGIALQGPKLQDV
jgi:hypothetical protein